MGNYGNIISAIGVVLAVLTAAIGSYVTTRQDIIALTGRVTQHDYQFSELTHAVDAYHKEQTDYQNEMRAQVARATDLLTDVRLMVTELKHHGK